MTKGGFEFLILLLFQNKITSTLRMTSLAANKDTGTVNPYQIELTDGIFQSRDLETNTAPNLTNR